MSNRWPGGVIRKTPVTPAGPFQNGAASGVWSLADAAYWTKQGLWPIAGNEQVVPEDVFSSWLYTGNGASSQTINNGVDLTGRGGMVWIKSRSTTGENDVWDTSRGANNLLVTNGADGQGSGWASYFGFNSSGFSLTGNDGSTYSPNRSGVTYASWTFREAPKFFDVVTWTGNGANRNIAHNLGVVPGMIIVKRTDTTGNWQVYHRSNANTQYMVLNSTAAVATGTTRWNSTTPTATEFTVGTDATVNASGGTYVAYLYAHNTASDGIIQCGSVTGTGVEVNLGWEPQWLLMKQASTTGGWFLADTMRGMPVQTSSTVTLFPDNNGAEGTYNIVQPTATGFINGGNSGTLIYVAIRRGPMRTPTVGTSVFSPIAAAGSQGANLTTGFPVDLQIQNIRTGASFNTGVTDRLRTVNTTTSGGVSSGKLTTRDTTQENSIDNTQGWNNTGFSISFVLGSSTSVIYWNFRRAPGFFDEVCYTGTGSTNRSINHNLGVAPELIIAKSRSTTGNWVVGGAPLGWSNGMYLNDTGASGGTGWFTTPTSTTFVTGGSTTANPSGVTCVAYLFASCPGVSKVGTYTGTGALQTINCAFTTGARFVLIKRTDSTGDWFVWDSARGISSGNDPYSLLNTSAAETTGTNYVDTDTTGFKVTAAAPAGINASGGTYLFLAIA